MANNIDRRNIASDEAKASFVKRIEAVNREKDSLKGSFMKECAVLNEQVKDILEEAKAAGIPKPSLKAVIKTRVFEDKARKAREELEADDLAIFVSVREALGDYADLPLGAAAVHKDEGQQDPATAAIIAAVQADEKPDPAVIEEQRKRDAAEFDAADKPKSNVTNIDPKGARANRTKAKDVSNDPTLKEMGAPTLGAITF